jgi:hypothetical protein
MDVYIVRFACFPGDEPKNFILDDTKYDDWITAEPPQGYACFERVWHGDIEAVYTALNDLRELCTHTPRQPRAPQ